MGGYLGTKAVLLSTTAANVTGNADITGNLTVGGNLTVSGTTITVDHANAQTVDLGDNDKIRLGADYELQLWSDGTTGQISGDINHTGSLTTDGLTLGGNVTFGDSNKIIMGAGSDLQIYHDGTRSYLDDVGSGSLWLRGGDVAIKSTASETMAEFANNGAATLYYDNAVKFATTSTGVDIASVGTAGASGTNFIIQQTNSGGVVQIKNHDSTEDIEFGQDYFRIKQGGSERMRITSAGNMALGTTSANEYSGYTSLTLDNATNGGIIDFERGGNLIGEIFTFDSSTFALSAVGARSINFSTNSLERLRIDSNGHLLHTPASQGSAFVPNTSSTWNALEIFQDRGVTNSASGIAFRSQSGTAPAGIVSVAGNTTGGIEDLAFMTASGNQTFERLRITSAGNVGIGTSSPSTFNSTGGKLAVASGAGNVAALFSDATYYTLGIKHSGVGSEAVGMFGGTSGSGLALMTNNTERMRITSSGNVGIGDSSPSRALSTKSSSVTVGSFESTSASGGLIGFVDPNTTNDVTVRVGALGNDLVLQAGGSERMRLTSTGNLGLGTTSPHSTAWSTDGQGTQMEIAGGTGTSGYGVLHLSGSGQNSAIKTYTQGVGDGNFYMAYDADAGAHRMIMNASGDVFIGKTSFNNAVGCAFNQNGVGYFVAGGGSVPLLINSITSNTTQTLVQFYKNSGGVGSISVSGSVTSYITSSDYRLKTDVQPMTGASERVQALNPVNFEWIADGTRVDGFLAHEAATVVPEAITGEKDAMRDEEYEVTPAVLDDDGNVATEAVMGTRSVIDPQGIDQSKIVPLLTAALQEALTKIDSLETRLTALEGA